MKKYLKLIFILFPPFFLFVLIFIVAPRIIVINDVVCKSQYGYCGNFLDPSLKDVKGKKYLYARKEILNILKENELLSSFHLIYKPPGTFLIDLTVRKGKVVIKSTPDNEYYTIDEQARIISKGQRGGLPLIITDESLSDKISLAEEYKLAIAITDRIEKIEKTENILIYQDRISVKIENGPWVFFPKYGDPDFLVGAYVVTNNQLNSNLENLRIDKEIKDVTLDIRFKNPVIY